YTPINPNIPLDLRRTHHWFEDPNHLIPGAPTPLKSSKEFPNVRFVTDKQPVIAIISILSDGQHIVQALKGGYRMTHAKGFTLVELMVTIAVAAILMAIAMPSLESISNSNALKSTTRDLVSTLSTARSQAISTRTDVLVQPAAGGWGGGWSIVYDNAAAEDNQDYAPREDVTVTRVGS